MGLIDRIRATAARLLFKAANISFVPAWMQSSFFTPTWKALVKEGYKGNSAVMACASALAFAFPEPPLMVYKEGEAGLEPQLTHPLRKLFRRPNPSMDESTFKAFCIIYAAIGGNAYIYRRRGVGGRTVELWPFSDGNITPLPGRNADEGLVRGYEYWVGGKKQGVFDPTDIIHWRWLPDPEQPWRGIGALVAAAREVDQDSEATRYLFQLLKNDAIPRVVVTLAQGDDINDDKTDRLMREWNSRHGGEQRGTAAFIEHGMAVEKLSFDLQELAFGALKSVPEARIASNFRTPPIIAGLNVGLEQATYSNYQEARVSWTQDTLVKLWSSFEAAIDMAFIDEYKDDVIVQHDTSEVAALKELEGGLWERHLKAYDSAAIKRSEFRRAVGLKAGPEDEVYKVGLAMSFQSADDQTSEPPQPVDEEPSEEEEARWRGLYEEKLDLKTTLAHLKASPPILQIKQRRQRREMQIAAAAALQRVRRSTAGKMSSAVDAFFEKLAEKVEERLNAFRRDEESGAAEDIETKQLPTVDDLLTADDIDELVMIERRFTVELLSASWDVWNLALGTVIDFDLTDDLVTSALSGSGSRIRGIHETTRQAVEDILKQGNDLGLSIDQLARGVPDEGVPGIRDTVKETYRNRAKTIARTELGEAQNKATATRYEDVGVSKVFILDNGDEDDDDPCKIANGQIWTLAVFKDNTLQHPNCTRAGAPELGDAEPDRS